MALETEAVSSGCRYRLMTILKFAFLILNTLRKRAAAHSNSEMTKSFKFIEHELQTIGIEEDEIREKIRIVCFAIAPVTAIQTTKTTMRTSKSIQTQTSSESFTLDCYFHLFHRFCRRRLHALLSPVHISFFSFLSWVQIHESMGCNEI